MSICTRKNSHRILKAARKKKELTQKELASLIDVSDATIRKLESEAADPIIFKVSNELDINIFSILEIQFKNPISQSLLKVIQNIEKNEESSSK